MAEERNLGLARAPETDEDHTKAELQRRMEEARESITQTVTEIKDTVAQQYNSVKESVTDALDWREQFRRRPVAWTVGALGVGFVVGYSLGGAIGGDDDDEDARYPSYDETDAFARTGASTEQSDYAAQALTGGAYGSSEYAVRATPPPQAAVQESAITPRPSYSSGYDAATATTSAAAEEEENKPGLIERFKETRAYDRLQEEVSELGNRFMDELANAARTVVLPALFSKLKELVGVDLSNKPQSGGGGGAAGTGARLAYSAPSTSGSTPSTPSTPSGTQSSQSNAQAATPSTGSGGAAQAASAGASQSRGRLDRFNDDRTTPGGGREAGQQNEGSGYDDRYERESQLYARSENRGFGTQSHGDESKTDTPTHGSGNPGEAKG
jgi:ElaB/YqjD/DUF883 family membrane-anchored ribosome-binding protein